MLHATYAVCASLARDLPGAMAALCAYRGKVENGWEVGFRIKPRFPRGILPAARVRPRFRQPCAFGGGQQGPCGIAKSDLHAGDCRVSGAQLFGGR